MYDANSIRRQLEEVWANFIMEQNGTRRERANKYKTKKIMMRAQGMQAYYEIEFEQHYLALSHTIAELSDAKPFEMLVHTPHMIGVLGSMAEALGLVEKTHQEPETVAPPPMQEDMFFAQHFTASLSDTMNGIRKKSSPGW